MKALALHLVMSIGVLVVMLVSGFADALPLRIPRTTAMAARPAGPDPLASASGGPGRSRGCSATAAVPGKTTSSSLVSEYWRRTYRVHVGASAQPGDPLPLVLNFHGRGGSGAAIEDYSGLLPVSDREGFLLVSPDGLGGPAGWGAGASLPQWNIDDIQFGKDLLAAVEDTYCVDTTRVYAVGHSNGAFMASRLACAMGGRIAAIAPVAGVYVPAEGCAAKVPVLAFHGTGDDVVPFNGGLVRESYRYRGTRREIADWVAIDRCGTATSTEQLNTRVTVETHLGCDRPVTLVTIKDAGHGWPGVPGTDLAGVIDTPQMIWDFLHQFRSAALSE